MSLPVPADPVPAEPPAGQPTDSGQRADNGQQTETRQEDTAPPAGRTRSRRTTRVALEWGVVLVVAVVAALLIRAFVVQPFYIPSASMEPTLKVGDRVLVNKLSYHLHSVHRGDVVVFKKPPDDDTPGITDLVKRVIGLPGETISGRNGQVYIDGKPLSEPWLPKGVTTAPFPSTVIPRGDYFMMGDNRGDSADSRVIGPIPGRLFIGRAFVRVWPLSRLGWL